MGSYRQIVAAIAKRYVKALVTATIDPAFQAITRQFGHDVVTLDHQYGLDESYPERL
jgi:hypothetical protein